MYKADFPIFANQQLIYLDSAASTQKPDVVLDAMDTFYKTIYSNVHRGNCATAIAATEQYEQARQTVADFIHTTPQNIVFTKGATEAVNLLATGFMQLLKPGDEVLISMAEHHAVFVPWQQACFKSGAAFKIVNILPDGRLDMDDLKAKLSPKTKLVAIAQMSNVLGVINPVAEIARLAHAVGALMLVDGAQSVAHLPIDVAQLDCDYFVFSGHKIYGPTGIGVLYGKKEALELLPPYQFGGDMIKEVSPEKTTFADLPARLEAGTPPIVETIGLAAALRYVSKIGMAQIATYEQELTRQLTDELVQIENIQILGDPALKSGIVAFTVQNVHPSDLAFVLSKQNICVRVGHHCAMPIHQCFHQSVSLRVSLGLYNTAEDIQIFIQSLKKALALFGGAQ